MTGHPTHIPLTVESWQDDALCNNQLVPEWWFSEAKEEVEHATAVCQICPVQIQCGDYALNYPTRLDGIWGGLDRNERQRIRRRRNRT